MTIDQQIQPLHSKYGMAKDGERRSVYSVLVSLQCFLSAHEYATLHNRLLKLCHQLSKQLTSLPMECVMELLGLPDDWYVKSKNFLTDAIVGIFAIQKQHPRMRNGCC